MNFYFIWLIKGILTVPFSKFDNEETRIILFSLFWFPECWFGLVTSTYSCSHSLYSEPVTHSLLDSSWLFDSSPGTFQIFLRKFVFCLRFERYHITPSLSRLSIWFSVLSVEIFTMFDILSNSFTLIVVYKGLCLKLWTLRLYYLDILPEHLVQRKWFILFSLFFTTFLVRRLGLWLFFFSQRDLHSVPNIKFVCYSVIYFVPVPVIMGRIMKMYSNHFNGELWYWWKQLESCEWIYSCNRTSERKWDPRETEILVHPVKSIEKG